MSIFREWGYRGIPFQVFSHCPAKQQHNQNKMNLMSGKAEAKDSSINKEKYLVLAEKESTPWLARDSAVE